MNVDKVVMKEKIQATIDLLAQLLADFTEEAPVVEEKPAKATTKGKKAQVQQEEASVEEKPAKATKGKKKVAPEPEPEEAPEEDEGELTLEDLKGMDLAELKELATAQELEMPKIVTKATLLKAFEEQFFSEEEEAPAVEEEPEEKPAKKGGKKKAEPAPEPAQEEEGEEAGEEEELTAEDINEMSLEELKGIVEEYELEIPATTLKNVKKLRAAIIEIIEAPDEEEEEEGEEADEDFEASSERLEAEGEIEKEIRQLLKTKKLTTAKMKKFLANYYEGNADCEDCSNCSTEELTACYIQTKQALVDDEGEVHEEAEAYTRNGEDYCCGVPLQEDNSCAICGSEYAEEDEE